MGLCSGNPWDPYRSLESRKILLPCKINPWGKSPPGVSYLTWIPISVCQSGTTHLPGSLRHPVHHTTASTTTQIWILSSLIQTILLVPDFHRISRGRASLHCTASASLLPRVADFTASREFHPTPKNFLFSTGVIIILLPAKVKV